LRIWNTHDESVSRDDFVRIHFPLAGFDIDRDVFASVIRLYLRANVAVVNLIPPPGELFFRVASLA
jgi:hypothetical protein